MSLTPHAICAVITTFHPDEGFADRVVRVHNQVGCVVIIDDGESSDNVNRLSHWFFNNPKIILHHNEINVGIAASLNKGIGIAKSKGYLWVLTLDDDTLVASDMVQTLIDYWKQIILQGGKPIALMGMLYRDVHTGEISDHRASSKGYPYTEKREIMTSGSLLSINAHNMIGPFREEFIIDFVDYDYCFRARSMGFRTILILSVGMMHSIGRQRNYKIVGKIFETFNHTPARLYYYFRNSSVFIREVFLSDPLFALALFISNLRTVLLVMLLENGKKRKIFHILRGVIDGCRNRLGRTISPSGLVDPKTDRNP